MDSMTWLAVVVGAAVFLVVALVVARRRGRNSGAARSRDVDPVNTAHADAHGYATQHQQNLHGGGGLGF